MGGGASGKSELVRAKEVVLLAMLKVAFHLNTQIGEVSGVLVLAHHGTVRGMRTWILLICKWPPWKVGCLLGRSVRSMFVTGIAAASSSLNLCVSVQIEVEEITAATPISLIKSNKWLIDY